jgi:hypothetical protein
MPPPTTAEAGADARLQRAAAVAGAAIVACGVLFAGWSPLVVLALYWAENVAIGAFNVLRLLVAGTRAGQPAGALFSAGFFIVHYGLFTLVHGVFVVAIFARDVDLGAGLAAPLGVLAGTLFADRVSSLALFALAAGAAADTWRWIASDESRTLKLDKVMAAPYGRVVVLHVALIGGGFLVQLLGAPAVAVLLLVALKLWFDLRPPRLARRAQAATEAAWKE